MKTVRIGGFVLAAILGFGLAQTALADSATLEINGNGGDPDLITGDTVTVLQNQAQAATIDNLTLLFSVAGVSTTTSPITVTSVSSGTAGAVSLVGVLPTSSGCNGNGKDVYSCSNLTGTDQSNSLQNFNNAEQAVNGFTAATYGIYAVTITNADLSGKETIDLDGILPNGTFVDAYGVSTDGTFYDTAFTNSGLVATPEASSLLMLGLGLVGIVALGGRRMRSEVAA